MTELKASLGEPTVANSLCPDFYRARTEREQLQLPRARATWTEQPERSVEVLLNFGCKVRRARLPHSTNE